jgi:hypothetical protein
MGLPIPRKPRPLAPELIAAGAPEARFFGHDLADAEAAGALAHEAMGVAADGHLGEQRGHPAYRPAG